MKTDTELRAEYALAAKAYEALEPTVERGVPVPDALIELRQWHDGEPFIAVQHIEFPDSTFIITAEQGLGSRSNGTLFNRLLQHADEVED